MNECTYRTVTRGTSGFSPAGLPLRTGAASPWSNRPPPAIARRPTARPDAPEAGLSVRTESGNRRGAVLVFTLVMIFMTTVAIFLFIEKSIYEIRSEAIHAEHERLRPHAYSVLEALMAVMLDVREIDGTFHDFRQGWNDPLEYARFELPGGMTASVSFRDESGLLPLPRMTRDDLILLFEELGYDPMRIEDLADALLGWMDESQDQSQLGSGFSSYDQGELPYLPSYEPLRSFYEFAAIDGFRELFFDSGGAPTDELYRFASMVSLMDFQQVNVNSASSRVLRVWGRLSDTHEVISADQFREETLGNESAYFQNLGEANSELGTSLPGGRFGTNIRYLRANIRVSNGSMEHKLSVLFDLDTPAEIVQDEQSENQNVSASDHVLQNYPFTVLELRENAGILF